MPDLHRWAVFSFGPYEEGTTFDSALRGLFRTEREAQEFAEGVYSAYVEDLLALATPGESWFLDTPSASEAVCSSAQAGGATRAFRASSGDVGYVSVSGGQP